MKKDNPLQEASPFKSVSEELDALRQTFGLVCRHYAERVDHELTRLHERVTAAGQLHPDTKKKTAAAGARARAALGKPDAKSQLHDLRDMLILMRTLEIKPTAGRRRDLKKIESAVDDLRQLIERWD